ncbi:hypothetical protein B0I72DRAFT_151698 [Yarrowia lipolytica]|jgi:Zn-dependent protease with chaperone function|uniref:YALI0E12309p n=2 Tax=Yarrowia lipolytica TaxID=4952 RepID=Q6C655_YARLI|nr:YALI0E12309p [Yarrowia lipolytica CLIB122]AOW05319.1 hypothetical protein YALI1_E15229g [Yarrowia lipolytica]KAB8283787.1 hypothetical protein BKA91DRAFT_110846 [Yarrowia lipolytica]KAE8172712.1 hypothetical protein BKA90DRAFT_111233 [Yarrowia lipolytica]KAJ8056837.1 hypothetical protein LXG23DRAFT_46270 [Yarrowia lipolytica]QNQ00197.1 Hypothetical protein YALI2_E01512g [Yarrowia lipolytica]|eukprot:XP_503857.1 YALI0E12309p [Yarrowia lipolytica CLIB122]
MGTLIVVATAVVFVAEMVLQARQLVYLGASHTVPPELTHMLDCVGLRKQNQLAWAELRSQFYLALLPFVEKTAIFGLGLLPWIIWASEFIQGRLRLRLSQIHAPQTLITMALSDCVNAFLASAIFYILQRISLLLHAYERDANVLQLHITKMEYLSEYTSETLQKGVVQCLIVGFAELAVSALPWKKPHMSLVFLVPLIYTATHMMVLKIHRTSPPPNAYPLMECQLRSKLENVARDLNFPNPTQIYVYHKGKPRIHVAGWTKKTTHIYIHNHLLTMHTHPEILLFVAHVLAGRLFPINTDTFPLGWMALSEYTRGVLTLLLCWNPSFHTYLGLKRWQPILLAVYIIPCIHYPIYKACQYANNYWKRSQTFQKDAGLVCLGNVHLSYYGYTLSSAYKRVSPLDGDPLWLTDLSGRSKLKERLEAIGWVPRGLAEKDTEKDTEKDKRRASW